MKLMQAEPGLAIKGMESTQYVRLAFRRQHANSVLMRRADLRGRTDKDELIAKTREQFRHLNILFANAGIGFAAPLENVTEYQIDEQFAVKFKSIFLAVQKAAPSDGGSIVVTTSLLNSVGTPGLSILSATKAAVRSLVRSPGAELAPRYSRQRGKLGPISTPFHSKLGLSERN